MKPKDAERLRRLIRRKFTSRYFYATYTKPIVHLIELRPGDFAALKRILAHLQKKGKPTK